MKRILILDANQRSALSVTRSLGKHNIPIITAESSATSLAGCSRYTLNHFQYPDPATQPEQFINFISKLAQDHNIQIIFPMTELTTTLLLENKNKFGDIVLPFPELSTINSISDKCKLMNRAELLNIPIPHTWHEDNPTEMKASLDNLKYPLVLKPGKSWIKQNEKWFHTLVKFAENPSSARDILSKDPAFSAHPFMLQKCVSGAGQGIFALYNQGEAIAFFSHHRIREKPYWGGVSVLSESISIDPTMLSYSRKLLDAVHWHGIAMVEFKVSDEGIPYLMEINTRFWGSLQLAVDAGVDFPWLLYKIATGEHVEPVKQYKEGIRLRWILGDLDSLYIRLKDNNLTLTNKFVSLLKFLNPNPFKTRHEVNRLHDMKPFWFELKQYFKELIR